MKRKRRRRDSSYGAVTVFLTLILIPCMIFVCAFGDVSRVALSKSQAVAASDLALYSLMANYDEELKEWYGLVAGCQDIDSFYSISKEYFVGMMDAAGLDDTASSTIVGYLDAARSGDFTDFLQVEGLDSVNVGPVDNGAMGDNPALIEDGIVEFMKYRGPIVIVENIVDRFSQMDFSGLLEANENQSIVDAKQTYAETEGAMMSDMLYTYLAIEAYADYRTEHGVPDMNAYQNEIGEKLSYIQEDFARVTEVITKYYAATDGIKDLTASPETYGNFARYTLPDTTYLNNDADAVYYYNDHNGNIYHMEDLGAVDDGEGNYSIDDAALNALFVNVDDQIAGIETAAANIVSACSGITAPVYGTGVTPTNDINDAVYCMRIQNAVKTSDLNTIVNNGKALMQTYAKILLLAHCDMPESWWQTVENYRVQIENTHRNYLSYTAAANSDYETLVKTYRTAAVDKGVVGRTTGWTWTMKSSYYNQFVGADEEIPIGTFLQVIREEFGTLIDDLDAQIAHLDTVLNGGTVSYGGKEYSVVSLDTLKQEIIDYSNARDDWGEEAYAKDTSYAESEQKEYEGVTTTNDLPAALYENGAESVEVLRSRLTNIRDDMQSLRDALDGFTYGGVSIWELDRTTAVQAARTVVPTTVDSTQPAYIGPYLSENATAAQGYHQQLFTTAEYTPPQLIGGEDGNNPELREDIPALYEYMREAFPKKDLEDALNEKDKWEQESEENREKADQEAEDSKGFDSAFLDDLGSDPKETSGFDSFDAGTVITGLVGAVEKLLGGNFDEFRDQIYVVSYIMEMYGYSSYDNEGEYNLSDTPLTLTDYDLTQHAFPAYLDGWHETDPTKFTKNKSLTNKMINSGNNYSNLAEVEYVLYGGDTNEDNLETAYGQIFAMREAINLISGFVNFYTGTNPTAAAIQTIAASLMAATMGVVPEAVTKVVLIGILATMETAHDLKRLKAGVPVAVYKKEDQWFYSISGSSRGTSEGSAEIVDENGLFYSDYLLLFLLIAANDTDLYSDMLLRVGDLVEQNMQTGGGKEDFDLEEAQCYFQLTGTVKVKPLLVTLPLVTNYDGADSSKLLESTDWCTYKLSVIRGYS